MILLSKLDNSSILVSLEAIKYMESTPDTIIFFLNGDSIIVKESLEEIQKSVIEYKVQVLNNVKF